MVYFMENPHLKWMRTGGTRGSSILGKPQIYFKYLVTGVMDNDGHPQLPGQRVWRSGSLSKVAARSFGRRWLCRWMVSLGVMTFTSVDFGLFSNRDLCRLCQFEQVTFFFSLGMMYI